MNHTLELTEVKLTPLLRGPIDQLQQCVRLKITNTDHPQNLRLVIEYPDRTYEHPLPNIPAGLSQHQLFIDELKSPTNLTFTLKDQDRAIHHQTVSALPPKHWTVHLVQLSHHDYGYTNLPSNVLTEHAQFLDQVIDFAQATRNYPPNAQFRIVSEAAWSILHFLRHRPADQCQRLIALMQSGHIELTALFGNLTTEICGPEILTRAAYHAFQLKRRHNIPIVSAEHNDIPGISWGLCQVLTDLDIKIFCPGLPLYYSWGHHAQKNLPSFWDVEAIFGADMPGAFWWQAPSGKRILFWCNNVGCGGERRADLPLLADTLQQLNEKAYPYDVFRFPVQGGGRDNSPYIIDYCNTVKQWNKTWTYPRLINSTNALFYQDFAEQLPDDLPTFAGELPGQDYPAGATSTARETALIRNTHVSLPTAEKLAVAAQTLTDHTYPTAEINDAYEQTLFYDLHAWGYSFPAGPTPEAARAEKVVHAYRAAALTHDITQKALARIADNVKIESRDVHLVLFNPLPHERTCPVNIPLRELVNCNTTMMPVPAEDDPLGSGFLLGVPLTDRWHVNPDPDLVDGRFDLIDLATHQELPHEITEITDAHAPEPYAAQRLGGGTGSSRMGLFEVPFGLKRNLRFLARNLPAFGYKTYRLKPRPDRPTFSTPTHELSRTAKKTVKTIQNQYYRIRFDQDAGKIVSILDKENQRELLDHDCPHNLGDLVVRDPQTKTEHRLTSVRLADITDGPTSCSLHLQAAAYGHPIVSQRVTLYRQCQQIHFDCRILKDATPLLDVHIAFPFKLTKPRFRYESCLSIMTPIADYLPGSHADRITVQNWVQTHDEDFAILLAPIDVPIVSLGQLWPGYVSPAHSCIFDAPSAHQPLTSEDLCNAWIYSGVFHNNFGTNFYVSQPGETLFRYVITTAPHVVPDAQASRWAADAVTHVPTIYTKHQRPRTLPPCDSLLHIEDSRAILQTCKQAQDGNGLIIRLFNPAHEPIHTTIQTKLAPIKTALLTNLAEEPLDTPTSGGLTAARAPQGPKQTATDGSVQLSGTDKIKLTLPPHSPTTLRLLVE